MTSPADGKDMVDRYDQRVSTIMYWPGAAAGKKYVGSGDGPTDLMTVKR